MPTGTTTRPATQSSPYTHIVYDTRKVQADLFSVIDTYGYFSENHAAKLITDIRTYLDNKVLTAIQFIWKDDGTNDVLEALRYNVVAGGVSLADDRPGGIRYNAALVGADFNVRVTYNERWQKMSDEEKDAVRDELVLPWGPAATLNYSKGSWQSADKSYSHNGQDGLSRQRFTR